MSNLFDLLDRDWARLATNRPARHQLADICRLAANARTLADLEAYVRAATPRDADRILLALVTRAVDGDDLAARVLLQLLLPGTKNLARRWWALGDDDERAAAAVAAVYRRIRNYPLARRPGRVAANVLMDAAHELRRAIPPANVDAWPDPTTLHAHHAAPDPHPADELAEVLADAVANRLITHDDAALIAQTRIAGTRVADLATRRTARPRTLWDRRQRAERTLTHHSPTLLTA